MEQFLERARGALGYRAHRVVVTLLGVETSGPKVLVNTIPKSGSHLLVRCLEMFPNLRYCRRHVHRRMTIEEIEDILRRVDPGYFATGHLTFTPERFRLLTNLGFSILLMIRDPRDVAVSHFHYVTYSYRRSRLHPYFIRLPDDSARLMASILGVDPPDGNPNRWLDNIGDRFRSYLRWAEHGACVVRFEHLVGPQGGGNHDLQRREIRRVAEYLGIALSEDMVEHIARRLYHRHSRTFRRGAIGDWKNYFTPAHKEAFKRVAGELLIELGYESDPDW